VGVEKGNSMIKRISLAITAALLVVALSAPAALAAPLSENCMRGDKGAVVCEETTTTSGKNERQEKFQTTTTTTTTTQGNEKNFSPEPKDTGTKSETECGDPCPPGQFK
jgi:hypothetical protein